MFKQARTCSQFFDMMMRHTPGHLLVLCFRGSEMYCAINFSRLFTKQWFGIKPFFLILKLKMKDYSLIKSIF